jgi:thymidylate synthase ThyX
MITAKIILDSVNSIGIRLTTMQLEYPRMIHSEMMTHRVFSRNASSSRAIPVETMIKRIMDNPAMPVHWGANQKGMQASEELTGSLKDYCEETWLQARNSAVCHAQKMIEYGLHKQIANRILEPWMHIQVVLTATEFENFDSLRIHKDAQPEIKVLAENMKAARDASIPNQLQNGEWHLPYLNEEEKNLVIGDQLKISTARCCRVSYLLHDNSKPTIQSDIALHNMLVAAKPIHASPTEHQAMSMGNDGWYKNFRGWRQYRSLVENGE